MFITAIRSLIVSASVWSWVTKMNVIPSSAWSVLSSTWRFLRSCASSAPQRLVEQQHARLQHQGARERDALLLSARELVGLAPRELGHADQLERLPDPLARSSLVSLWYLSPNATFFATSRCGNSA